MRLRVIPVINENDTTATHEIRIGDNDNLSAQVANLVDADLLLILTDIAGLYTADPSRDPSARLIEEVPAIDAASRPIEATRRRTRPCGRLILSLLRWVLDSLESPWVLVIESPPTSFLASRSPRCARARLAGSRWLGLAKARETP